MFEVILKRVINAFNAETRDALLGLDYSGNV